MDTPGIVTLEEIPGRPAVAAPDIALGQRVWVLVVGGYRQMIVTGVRTEYVGGLKDVPYTFDANPETAYQLRFAAGKHYSDEWGWCKADEILLEKPEYDCLTGGVPDHARRSGAEIEAEYETATAPLPEPVFTGPADECVVVEPAVSE